MTFKTEHCSFSILPMKSPKTCGMPPQPCCHIFDKEASCLIKCLAVCEGGGLSRRQRVRGACGYRVCVRGAMHDSLAQSRAGSLWVRGCLDAHVHVPLARTKAATTPPSWKEHQLYPLSSPLYIIGRPKKMPNRMYTFETPRRHQKRQTAAAMTTRCNLLFFRPPMKKM